MSGGYVPNVVPLGARVQRIAGAALIVAYGAFGIFLDDLIIPAKHGSVHLHGLPAWCMLAAIVCAAAVLLSAVADHYDTRNNEAVYRRFGKLANRLGWLFFALAMSLNLAGVAYPAASAVTVWSAVIGALMFLLIVGLAVVQERNVERLRASGPAPALPRTRLGRAARPRVRIFFAVLLGAVGGLLLFIAVPGLFGFHFISAVLSSLAVAMLLAAHLLFVRRHSADAASPRRPWSWRPVRIALLLIVGVWAIWYTGARQQGVWDAMHEDERRAAPAWPYGLNDFTGGQSMDELRTRLSAQGFRMRCYGNLTAQEKIEPDDIALCWTIANNTAGIPSSMITLYFGAEGLRRIRFFYRKDTWEAVKQWFDQTAGMSLGTFSFDQDGHPVLGRMGRTGVSLVSKPGVMGWVALLWLSRERIAAGPCRTSEFDDARWRLLCRDWQASSEVVARGTVTSEAETAEAPPFQRLERIFDRFPQCPGPELAWVPGKPPAYIAERGLRPYDTSADFARFRLFDVLFGLQVRELWLSPTGKGELVLVFDETLADARRVLAARFGDDVLRQRAPPSPVGMELVASADGRRSQLQCRHEP